MNVSQNRESVSLEDKVQYEKKREDKWKRLGKGKGNRVLAHLDDESESEKTELIKQIRSQGKEPHIEFLVHGLKRESDALRIESAAIDLIGYFF